ncbi:MAG: hypothetical protein WD638_06590 [Nitriliruptoraceae bacterium]
MRHKVDSGTSWGSVVGYSRAVRIGSLVEVAGITAALPDGGVVGGRDPAEQAREAVGRVHGGFFADIRPVTTMVEVSRLIAPELLVEIEATAVCADGS